MGSHHNLETAELLKPLSQNDLQVSGVAETKAAESTTARIDRAFRRLNILLGLVCVVTAAYFLYQSRETLFPADPEKRRENVADAILWAVDEDVTVQEIKDRQKQKYRDLQDELRRNQEEFRREIENHPLRDLP